MTEHPTRAILTIRPTEGTPRRYRIEPAETADGVEFWLVEQQWDGRVWREVGREPLSNASLEAAPEFVEWVEGVA